MKKVVLVFAVLLAVTTLVLISCKKSTSGTVDYGARVSGPNYWWAKFTQPVTLHVVNMERPATPFLTGDSVTSNEWTRGFKEALNVEVVTDWVASGPSYFDRINLAIAAKEIPDVFLVNPTQFRQLVEAGMLADLTDYIENNASDMVKKIMAAAPEVTASATFNGRLMGMPRYEYGPIGTMYNIWLRHDFVEQNGVSQPQTFEDLERIMDIFMRTNPGSYGFGLNRNLNEFYQMASAFGAKPKIWIDGSGGLVYGSVQPEIRAALEKFADWYKRGYLRKDFTSIEERDVINDMAASRVGMHTGLVWYGWMYTDIIKALGTNSYFEAYAVPSGNGRPHVVPVPFDNRYYIAVNKNCKNIPAVLKCISYGAWVCMEAELQDGGLTGDQVNRYLLGGEGKHDLAMLVLNDPFGNGTALYEWCYKVSRNNYQVTEKPLTAEWLSHLEQARPWFERKDIDGYGRWIQQFAPNPSAYINAQLVLNGQIYSDRLIGSLPEDASVYGTTLDDLLLEGYTKIIVGQEPLSYFDTVVAEWRRSGGDVVTQAVNREYGKK
jgi:putative aldouronate transport system substrate-binding protein